MTEQEWRLILMNFAMSLLEHADNPASDLSANVARLRQLADLLEAAEKLVPPMIACGKVIS